MLGLNKFMSIIVCQEKVKGLLTCSFSKVLKCIKHFRKIQDRKTSVRKRMSFTSLGHLLKSHQNLLKVCYARQLMSSPRLDKLGVSGGEFDYHGQ